MSEQQQRTLTPEQQAWDSKHAALADESVAATLAEFGLEPDMSEPELEPEVAARVDAEAAEFLGGPKADPVLEAAEPEPEDDEASEPAPGAAPVAKKRDSATSAMLRLLDAEKKVREERESLAREREAFEAERSKPQEQPKDSITADQLRRVLRTNPLGLFQALGVTPSEVSPLIIYGQMGDKAPPEIQEAARRAAERAEFLEERDQLRAEREQLSRTRTAQEEFQRVRTDVQEYVKTGLSTHAPTVAELAKEDAAMVDEAIMDEIVRDAAVRHSRGETGKPLTAEQAVARLEKRWARIRKSPSSTNVQAAAPNAQKPAAGTPAVAPKKLANKGFVKPWLSEQEMSDAAREEQYLNEAIALERKLRRAGR